MTCKEMVDFLMAYLERELPEGQQRHFDEHLAMCPPCQVYLDTYRQTVALGQSICPAGDEPVPADVPEALVRAIIETRRDPR